MNRVFVLGAGATTADYPQAPLLKDLLFEALQGVSDKHSEKIRGFLSRYFFTLENHACLTYPTIQDVLSFIDIGLSDKVYFQLNKKDLEDVRNSIVYSMARAIEQGLNQTCIGEANLRLVEKVKAEDAIISTNYDIVIDNCFLKQYQNQINYGVKFRQAIDSNNTDNDGRARQAPITVYSNPDKVLLLKLHGSFNWLYCRRCNELDITPARKGIFDCMHDDVYCHNPMCTEKYQPLVVSPTFLKNYENKIIRDVWSIAEKTVSEADEIVFRFL